MRRLYALNNRNPRLTIENLDDDVERVRIIRKEENTSDSKIVVRRTTNNVVETSDTDVRYVETDNVYLNETSRCPYIRCPWWLWLLLALGLLALIGLALGLGLGLGLSSSSANSRCSGTTCPANSQCINNRCECNTDYFYDYTRSICSALLHVGMRCSISTVTQRCVDNANCGANGYCICNTGYFLDQVSVLSRLVVANRRIP
jgi:hypothetical protein